MLHSPESQTFSSVTFLKIRNMQRLLPFAFLIFNSVLLSAQQFGGNPSSLKWKQIGPGMVS
jgi:hypothetical protein